jgi:hypothetical protein
MYLLSHSRQINHRGTEHTEKDREQKQFEKDHGLDLYLFVVLFSVASVSPWLKTKFGISAGRSFYCRHSFSVYRGPVGRNHAVIRHCGTLS